MPRESESFWVDEEEDRGFLSFIAGAGIGLMVGVAVALSLAPQPGEVMRAELRQGLSRLRSRLRRQSQAADWES